MSEAITFLGEVIFEHRSLVIKRNYRVARSIVTGRKILKIGTVLFCIIKSCFR